MPEFLDKETAKEAMKEALKEWLDEKFMEFGKWTAAALMAALLAGAVYAILTAEGWHK